MSIPSRSSLFAMLVCVSSGLHADLRAKPQERFIPGEAKGVNRSTFRYLASAAVAQETMPVKIKLLTLLGRPLQLVAAEKLGLFSKFGLEVQNENSANSQEFRDKLATRNVDIAYLSMDNSVDMYVLTIQIVSFIKGC